MAIPWSTIFWLVGINFVCPTLPFLWPLRVTSVTGSVLHLPWWLVLVVANLAGAFGMWPVYLLARHHAHRWQGALERIPKLQKLRQRWNGNMFIIQILLQAVPLPDMVSSTLAGCEQYPFRRLLLAQFIGRSFHNLPLVIGGLALEKLGWLPTLLRITNHPVTWVLISGLAVLWVWRQIILVRQPEKELDRTP